MPAAARLVGNIPKKMMVEPFSAPVVDSLSVRVVVNSVFDQFMPKATHSMCTIEHVGRIRNNLNSTLAGEWGLSLHLESQAGGATGQYLIRVQPDAA